jgi:hypothetical protein
MQPELYSITLQRPILSFLLGAGEGDYMYTVEYTEGYGGLIPQILSHMKEHMVKNDCVELGETGMTSKKQWPFNAL